ncbi:MAG: flagellar hook-associated protein FlgK [Pseudomonadota bacterium]
MGLGGVLDAALSGLRVTSANLEISAHNIANADTPGYSRKVAGQAELFAGEDLSGVRLLDTTRRIDELIQQTIRNEAPGLGYAETLSRFYAQLDSLYGQPGGQDAIDTLFNEFRSSLEELSVSPESVLAREAVLGTALNLTNKLNAMSDDIQAMRLEAERGIASGMQRVEELLQSISDINEQITTTQQAVGPPAGMLDQRDNLLEELASLVDIRVVDIDRGAVNIFTRSGVLLLSGDPANLQFDERGSIGAQALYSTDPAQRSVGTIQLTVGNGLSIDLIADDAIRSGSIGAYIDLRDEILTQAQTQLDSIADAMARSLSSVTVPSTVETNGASNGLGVDVSGLQDGDSITLTYTDDTTNEQRVVTIVRVDEAGAPALTDAYTARTDDTVISLSFQPDLATAAASLQSALGPGFNVDAVGSNLRILDDGAANTRTIDALSATRTETSLAGGSVALPFFVDGGGTPPAYTARHGAVPQKVGFAERITVNPDLFDNPAALVAYTVGIDAGDPARPEAILERLVDQSWDFSGESGVTGSAPFSGNLSDFIRRTISFQAQQSELAQRAYDTESIAMQSLRERQSAASGVNIDEEMAALVTLQTAYQANARLINAYRELTDALLQIG